MDTLNYSLYLLYMLVKPHQIFMYCSDYGKYVYVSQGIQKFPTIVLQFLYVHERWSPHTRSGRLQSRTEHWNGLRKPLLLEWSINWKVSRKCLWSWTHFDVEQTLMNWFVLIWRPSLPLHLSSVVGLLLWSDRWCYVRIVWRLVVYVYNINNASEYKGNFLPFVVDFPFHL